MRALARSYIWWPGLDNAIENLVSDCEACKVIAAMPAVVSRHPWQHSNVPQNRVHIDYGEWKNYHLLVLIDSFSKWPEVKVVSTITTQMTMNVFSDIFETHGFPRILVSDNGPQFTFTEFADFLLQNNIIIVHYRSLPYHPSTNGLAENMVKSVKHHLKKHKPIRAPAHIILLQASCTHLSMVLPNICQ